MPDECFFICVIQLGPAVVKQLLEELEKSVKTLEDKYRNKAKAKNVRMKYK